MQHTNTAWTSGTIGKFGNLNYRGSTSRPGVLSEMVDCISYVRIKLRRNFINRHAPKQILSHLPSRILRLLAIAGFYGDRDIALTELHNVTDNCKTAVRAPVASIWVRTYQLYLEQMFGELLNFIEPKEMITGKS